jgi:hypothetical protein
MWGGCYESFFFDRDLPVASFFCPLICPWLPPKQITNKQNPGRFARGQKKGFQFYRYASSTTNSAFPYFCSVPE